MWMVSLSFTLTHVEPIVISTLQMTKVTLVRQTHKSSKRQSCGSNLECAHSNTTHSLHGHHEPVAGLLGCVCGSPKLPQNTRMFTLMFQNGTEFLSWFCKLPEFFSEFNLNMCLRRNRRFECSHNHLCFNCRFWT